MRFPYIVLNTKAKNNCTFFYLLLNQIWLVNLNFLHQSFDKSTCAVNLLRRKDNCVSISLIRNTLD